VDKIFSARLDEMAIDELNRCTRRLGLSKKQFLEEAIVLPHIIASFPPSAVISMNAMVNWSIEKGRVVRFITAEQPNYADNIYGV